MDEPGTSKFETTAGSVSSCRVQDAHEIVRERRRIIYIVAVINCTPRVMHLAPLLLAHEIGRLSAWKG